MEQCPNCRLPTELNARFCGNCGVPLAPALPQQAPAMQQDGYAFEPLLFATERGRHQADAGLVFGAMSLAISLFIPLVSLVLAITGLIFATIGRSHSVRKGIATAAVIVSAVGLMAGLGVWGYAISKSPSLKIAQGSNASSGSLVTVTTPCYSVSLDSGLQGYKPNNCNFSASSSAEEYSVNAIENNTVTSANFAPFAERVLNAAIKNTGGTLLSGSQGEFAGSQAYLASVANAANNTMSIYAMVYHPSAGIDNIYIIGRSVASVNQPSFGTVQTSWQWK